MKQQTRRTSTRANVATADARSCARAARQPAQRRDRAEIAHVVHVLGAVFSHLLGAGELLRNANIERASSCLNRF